MTGELREQLAMLRRKIQRIDAKYARAAPVKGGDPGPLHKREGSRADLTSWLEGEVVETPNGAHFEVQRSWALHRRHGSVDISSLRELPDDLLSPLSAGAVPPCPPSRWAFLDTETTGLAMGSGTYAFLVGVGQITADGFRVRQFFMRDFSEEASLLDALESHLRQFDVVVTYNGKVYDQPLLETRYRLLRRQPPFERLAHLDLLFGARRLWGLRLESCRLVELEREILGFEREGDLPGELIPYVYFDYLRTRQAFRLVPVFHHNAMDILTLACLTAVVPYVYRSPAEAPLAHGADWLGLARRLMKQDRWEEALVLLDRAVEMGLPEPLLYRTLWEAGCIRKRLGQIDSAVKIFEELSTVANPHQVCALEELAKYYEHRERNYSRALEVTLKALSIRDEEGLRGRAKRLEGRLHRMRTPRLEM